MTILSELKALAEAATPGPWSYSSMPSGDTEVFADCGSTIAGFAPKEAPEDYHNAAFIAAANPQTVLALIKTLEEAEKRLNSIFILTEKDPRDLVIRGHATEALTSIEALKGGVENHDR